MSIVPNLSGLARVCGTNLYRLARIYTFRYIESGVYHGITESKIVPKFHEYFAIPEDKILLYNLYTPADFELYRKDRVVPKKKPKRRNNNKKKRDSKFGQSLARVLARVFIIRHEYIGEVSFR